MQTDFEAKFLPFTPAALFPREQHSRRHPKLADAVRSKYGCGAVHAIATELVPILNTQQYPHSHRDTFNAVPNMTFQIYLLLFLF